MLARPAEFFLDTAACAPEQEAVYVVCECFEVV